MRGINRDGLRQIQSNTDKNGQYLGVAKVSSALIPAQGRTCSLPHNLITRSPFVIPACLQQAGQEQAAEDAQSRPAKARIRAVIPACLLQAGESWNPVV